MAEAVRVAVKSFLHESYLNGPFYAAVHKGEQSLQAGQGMAHSPELEDEIWQEGLSRAQAGQPLNPDVVPQ